MAAVVYAFGGRERSPLPWQNHELSELYRVVDLLGKAGLSVETDMGLSDEGEPWFVFCRADTGDVVVHFARIDGQYVAASSVVDQSYRGANFRDIIEQLVSQQPLVMPRGGNGMNLFLHPAVVLTAFVATALAHAHRAEAADGSDDTIPVSLNDGQGGHGDLLLKLIIASAAPHAQKPTARVQNSAETTAHLAALMAIAIAAIMPLTDQSVDLSLPPLMVAAAGHAAPISADSASDGKTTADDTAILSIHHDRTTVLNIAGTDAVSFDHAPVITQHSATSATMSLPASASSGEAGAQGTALPQVTFAQTSGDHTLLHASYHTGPVPAAAPGGAQQTTGTVQTATADTTHHFTLSDFDPAAIQVFFTPRENTATHNPNAVTVVPAGPTNASTSPGTTPATTPPSGNTGGTTVFPTETNIAINTWSAPELVYVLNDFAFSGTHPLFGTMQPSDYLRMAVAAYEKANGGPIQLIVFDEANPVNSIFPLTKGVLFVEDSQLGASAQTLHGANTVTLTLGNGDVMKLIGVITVDATHPLMG